VYFFYFCCYPLDYQPVTEGTRSYELYFRFIKTYLPVGFKGIDRNDPLILELEEFTKTNNQFFYIADVVRMKFEFTSLRSKEMLGIEPEELTSYHLKEATHPDDLARNGLGMAQIFKIAHELAVAKNGIRLLSSNFRYRNPTGNYSGRLVQCYFFFAPAPFPAVWIFVVHTDIGWFKKMKNGYHYYLGDDISFFRFPDDALLMYGQVFSDREFEIIKLIHSGLSSEQIGEKLFLSKYTIDTHRRNILEKTGKTHISELIYDLHEKGLL
jgi:DNA-binding CsgD family transcriptional regulator